MKLNGIAITTKSHQVKDVQEIGKYLDSLGDIDIVDVKISAYSLLDHNPRYVIIVFIKA